MGGVGRLGGGNLKSNSSVAENGLRLATGEWQEMKLRGPSPGVGGCLTFEVWLRYHFHKAA